MSSSRSPLVSVLITAYNREEFVGAAIASALASSLSDIEVIVADDASTDRTVSIASGFAERDERVRVFVNAKNAGDYPNRNRAAGFATGKYLKYLDSDDLIYSHGLQVMTDCMNQFPDAGLGLSAVPDAASPMPRALTPAEAYLEAFSSIDLFGRAPGSAIIRRSAFDACGGFAAERYTSDLEFWLRIARPYAVVKMPRDLVWAREHAGQEMTAESADYMVAREEIRSRALDASDCPLDPQQLLVARSRLGEDRIRRYRDLLLRRGPGAAAEFKRRTGIPTGQLAAFALRSVTRVARRRSKP